jgi:hypothetical protein
VIYRISVLVIFVMSVVTVGLANADEGQSDVAVSKYTAHQEKYIETYYDRRIAQLKRRAARQVRQTEQAENNTLKEQALIERERRINYWGFANPETLTSPKQQEATKRRIKNGTTAIESKLAIAIENMEKRKASDLKRLADRPHKPQAARPDRLEQPRGIVTGIAFSTDTPMVLLGNKIYGEGETADGVKIVKIHLGKVEFEKNGESAHAGTGRFTLVATCDS